ncbi:MAG: hypothetical protein KAT04_12000 [Methylococcales bacterium]|nr:hypothetical protein [Methylococcales bacterium]
MIDVKFQQSIQAIDKAGDQTSITTKDGYFEFDAYVLPIRKQALWLAAYLSGQQTTGWQPQLLVRWLRCMALKLITHMCFNKRINNDDLVFAVFTGLADGKCR